MTSKNYLLLGVCIIGLAAIYLIGDRILHYRFSPEPEVVEIPEDNYKVVSFWYSETGGGHLLLQPFSFADHIQQYNDKLLNKTFAGTDYVYYLLRIAPDSPFPVVQSAVILTTKDGKEQGNIPVKQLKSSDKNISLWLSAINDSASLLNGNEQKICLGVSSCGMSQVIPSGILKRASTHKYLIAFERPVKFEKIKEVKVRWNGELYTLSRKSCLRSVFDDYLRNPTWDYWQQDGT